MKHLKIVYNNEKTENHKLKDDIDAKGVAQLFSISQHNKNPVIFETETGALVLPVDIWNNCIIELYD